MAAQPSTTAITPDMVFNLSGLGNGYALFDGDVNTVFEPKHFAGFTATPATLVLRMNPTPTSPCSTTKIKFEAATDASGTLQVFAGEPGHWSPISAQAMPFGNGLLVLEWNMSLSNVRFLKFVFEKPGERLPQSFKTGEITLNTTGDCFFEDEKNTEPSPEHSHLAAADRMGVNNYIGKSQLYYQTAPFANVREYLPWDHIQGHLSGGNTSTQSTEQAFRFAPCFPGYDLDYHFNNLAGYGRKLLGTFKESSPFQMRFDYQGGADSATLNQLGLGFANLGAGYLQLMERKPGHPQGGVAPNNAGFCLPDTYKDHGNALHQLSLRYGKGGADSPNSLNLERSNQGAFSFIENWNEQDKWWQQPALGSPVDKPSEQRLAYFTPLEYMAMTFADHAQNNGLPLIMSGIIDFDADYVRGIYMAWWELTGQDPAENFPFLALNLHHYSLSQGWENGIVPEGDPQLQPGNPASGLHKIIAFRNKYLPNQQIWVTEFGYSDHPDDNTAALPQYANPDMEEVQAQWLVRNFLLFNQLGVDRAFTYQLTDDGPNAWHGMFNHTGVIDRTDTGGYLPEFRYKKAWYYLLAMRNVLKDQFYVNSSLGFTANNRPVWEYFFENQAGTQSVRAIWVPEDKNPGTEPYQLSVVPGANIQIMELTTGSTTGSLTELKDEDNNGQILLERVGERPIFVLEGSPRPALDCACSVPLEPLGNTAHEAAAAQALTGETHQINADHYPRYQYGPAMTNLWTGANQPITFNIGGGVTTDEWAVEGIYLHDPAGQAGKVTLELLDQNGSVMRTLEYGMDGQALFPYNALGSDFVWKRFDDLRANASSIRISKEAGAAIGEVLVCARSLHTCVADGIAPATPLLGDPTLTGTQVAINWPPATANDVVYAVQLLDSVGIAIGTQRLVWSNATQMDISALPCGRHFQVQVTATDCEGLASAAAKKSFSTRACDQGPVQPAQDCNCQPIALDLSPEHVFYELAVGQQIPASAWTGDPCLDNVPDKAPFRMVDEQNLIGKLCEANYHAADGPDFYACDQNNGVFPIREWFPGWPGAAAAYPFKAILHFDNPQVFNGIYLYDSNDQGKLSIEYRTSANDSWKTLSLPDGKNYLTRHWHKWISVYQNDNPLTASDLRVTLKDDKAHFAELALCQTESVRKGDVILGTPNQGTPSVKSKGNPKIFPVPTAGILFVEPGHIPFQNMVLTDVHGRQLRSITAQASVSQYSIDLKDLAKGLYFLTLWDGLGAVWQAKVVKGN